FISFPSLPDGNVARRIVVRDRRSARRRHPLKSSGTSNRAPKASELSTTRRMRRFGALFSDVSGVPFQRWNFKTTHPLCWSDFRTAPVLEMLQELSENGRMRPFGGR